MEYETAARVSAIRLEHNVLPGCPTAAGAHSSWPGASWLWVMPAHHGGAVLHRPRHSGRRQSEWGSMTAEGGSYIHGPAEWVRSCSRGFAIHADGCCPSKTCSATSMRDFIVSAHGVACDAAAAPSSRCATFGAAFPRPPDYGGRKRPSMGAEARVCPKARFWGVGRVGAAGQVGDRGGDPRLIRRPRAGFANGRILLAVRGSRPLGARGICRGSQRRKVAIHLATTGTALNPLIPVGGRVGGGWFQIHAGRGQRPRRDDAPSSCCRGRAFRGPSGGAHQYHQFSGRQCQRVMDRPWPLATFAGGCDRADETPTGPRCPRTAARILGPAGAKLGARPALRSC